MRCSTWWAATIPQRALDVISQAAFWSRPSRPAWRPSQMLRRGRGIRLAGVIVEADRVGMVALGDLAAAGVAAGS